MGFALHLQVVFRGGEVLKTCSNNLMFLEPSWRNMSNKVYPINVPLLTLQLLKRRARKRDTYGSEYSYSTHYERMPVTRTQSRKDGECKYNQSCVGCSYAGFRVQRERLFTNTFYGR